jgi:type VI secretion system secreted protein VgrG
MKRFILTAVACVILAGGATLKAQPPSFLPGLPPATAPMPAAPSLEDAKAAFQHPDVQKSFPRLGTNFKILAGPSKDYNAYAYVIGITNRWLVPDQGTADNPFAGVDKFLAPSGYQRMSTFDTSLQPGKQKVAVYFTVKSDGTLDQVTSAALQQPDGSWACKIGSMSVIQVPTLESLRGPTYGLAVAVYIRDAGIPQIGGLPR